MAVTQPPQTSPLAGVTAGSIMRPGVLVVGPDTPLRAVAQIMATQGVHAVLVPTEGPRGHGWPSMVVSDLDLVRAALDRDLDTVTADAAGTEHSALVDIAVDLLDVADQMAGTGADHLLVADRHSLLPDGIVSSFDIVAVLGGRDPRIARHIRPRPARPAISERRLDRVLVADAMHRGIVSCPPDTDLPAAGAAMADHRVHALAVGDRILEAMDLVRAAVNRESSLTAVEVAATERLTIGESADMEHAARLMAEHEVRHLIVADRSARPVGVVSTLDVATMCATS